MRAPGGSFVTWIMINEDVYGLGTVRTLESFQDRVGVNFRTCTESPDARNAGRPKTDFNDSIASGLEGVLGILSKAGMGGMGANDGNGDGVGPSADEDR